MLLKAALLSLGCKVNSYETEKIREDLAEKGFVIVDFSEKADVYIVNTCSVTNIADRKSRQMLHKAKSMNNEAIVVATGCYVQTEDKNERIDKTADIIVGNNHKSDIADIILKYLDEKKKKVLLEDISCEKIVENFSINDYPERTRAFVRIEDGCNQFCTYCIIPYARGRVRSRREEDILNEVKTLAEKGFKEVVLTGIHISSYGFDNYEKMVKSIGDNGTDIKYDTDKNGFKFNNDTGITLFDSTPLLSLIKNISQVKGIKRIRLSSLEPRIITEEFAVGLKEITAFCPHFHLSLQSGCDSVLKRMNRHYTAEEFLHKCKILRDAFDRPAISTDVIVGFPSETEKEFGLSLEMCKKAEFSKMHIFKYSRRKGTVADRMPGQLTEKQKHERSLIMQKLDEEMQASYISSFIGDVVNVLVEEKKDEYCIGLTERYVQVKFSYEGTNNSSLINSIVRVKILGKTGNGILFGELQKNA